MFPKQNKYRSQDDFLIHSKIMILVDIIEGCRSNHENSFIKGFVDEDLETTSAEQRAQQHSRAQGVRPESRRLYNIWYTQSQCAAVLLYCCTAVLLCCCCAAVCCTL